MSNDLLTEYDRRILTILIREGRFLTTAQIAEKTRMSWNTAEKYLRRMKYKGWVERRGDVVGYWKVIVAPS